MARFESADASTPRLIEGRRKVVKLDSKDAKASTGRPKVHRHVEPGGKGASGITGFWLKQKGWEPEVKFHPIRKWRFDWADLNKKLAIEIEGGVWIGGRHTSGSGFVKDMEKYNAAMILGWRILRYTPQQFKEGSPILDLEAIYKS